ncbi:MAG: 3-phosphoserine/phosphohydroxythreonine transaminase, partial [Polyangiaceae bacterium]|nr:3-phosphoserine/phosphohydroxythreonine transaminase [Polyangiaceae bacterium]
MARVYNFNAGPAALPLPVLERAQAEFIDFNNTGMSILEHSHRGKAYDAVHNEAIALLRELLAIPESYKVLFLQGGASQQFAMVPMNLLPQGKSADYIVTGAWSKKALQEAQIVGTARAAASTANDKFTRIATQEELSLDANAAYVSYASNETIHGVQYIDSMPEVGNVPLVCDMSSDFLWRKLDVSKFGLIYAGAQKNIGPAGVTCVIIRNDLVEGGRTDIPKI